MTASSSVPVPRAGDRLTTDSFAQLALLAGRGQGVCLVATALDSTGVSAGHLVVVPDLPASPEARSQILARTVLYLHAAIGTEWEYLAHAIVEPAGQGQHAVFAMIDRVPRGHR